ncbi:TetR/AcrR family transcriptional regulator [Achromobacter sp. KS-M25]|uniref:TetR/AcrR family transcriptional regulator n=1 Tax=Schauerella aestuarii TaxID=2511204 RepID=UPI00136B00D8|nr:TetR family transcriptional regulator [Achromobacter aestuarii]MYZ43368.1 TetR/AcrR family transcriptional regulator [Achromobacter aestuarii]
MKVTKAQAEANRARIVDAAAVLFRERGYDGVGVVDLMAAAGFTHGGFYNHFGSKAELMAEAAASSFVQSSAVNADVAVADFVAHYASRRHRDAPGSGCTIAALSGDAARQPDEVKAAFANGIERFLADLGRGDDPAQGGAKRASRADSIETLAQLVGAIVLSRACPDDSALSDEILEVCRSKLIASR